MVSFKNKWCEEIQIFDLLVNDICLCLSINIHTRSHIIDVLNIN